MRWRFFLGAVTLFVIVIAVNATILFSTLSGSFAQAVAEQYRSIAQTLTLAKTNSVFTSDTALQDQFIKLAQQRVAYITHSRQKTLALSTTGDAGSQSVVALTDADGLIINAATSRWVGQSLLPFEVRNSILQRQEVEGNENQSVAVRQNGFQYVVAPFNTQSDAGFAVIRLSEESVNPSFVKFIKQVQYPISMLFLLGFVAIFIVAYLGKIDFNDAQGTRRQLVLGVSVIAVVGQIVIVLLVGKEFSQHYLDISRTNASWVSQVAGSRLANSNAGVEYESMTLSRLMTPVSDIERFTVSRESQDGYTVRNPSVTSAEWDSSLAFAITDWLTGYENPENYIYTHTLESDGSYDGLLVAKINSNLVNERRQGGVFNGLMSIVIGLLIFVELIILLIKYVDRLIKQYRAEQSWKKVSNSKFHYSLMRPSMFLFLFGIDISISFLPLHMERLYEPIFGLSKAVVMGLPISVEFFCVGVAILFSGYWLDKSGWHKPYLCGLAVAALGSVWSWLAADAVQFILSRGLVGVGYGLALMSAQGFVIRYSDSKNKAQGLAQVYAGLYAGSICGGAAGGMLAERFGFSAIFLLGAGVLIFAVLYTLVFMRDAFTGPPRQIVQQQEVGEASEVGVARFLRDRSVLGLILFCSIPASVVIVGFLNYFSPIYMSRMGMSQSTIGQVLIIYGVCLIFLGPWAGKLIDTMDNKKPFIVLSGALGAASLLVFSLLDGLAAMVVAIVLLGLSSSFVFAAQAACLLQLPVAKKLGDGKAMGIFSSSGRIGQTLGPMIFAGVIGLSTIEDAATWIGLGYAAVTLLFILMFKRIRRPDLVARAAVS